jgi:hypothetical protein
MNILKPLAIAAMSIAMLIPAKSADIGDVVHFGGPYSAVVGCSDPNVAPRELHTRGLTDMQALARLGFKQYRRQDLWLRGFSDVCHVLDDTTGWTIVQKGRTQYTGPNDTWACLLPEGAATQTSCVWAFLRGGEMPAR